jgi:gamma-glutamyltranspeptidase/glutathione hydrolase
MGSGEEGGLVMVEEDFGFATLAELARRGHRLVPIDGYGRVAFGGGQIIMRNPETGVLIGGSEPRKDGAAVGW